MTLIDPGNFCNWLWGRTIDGVGDGNRTHNVRSHSPVLCQLSYSHRIFVIITTRVGSCQTQADEEKNKLRERGRE